MKSTAPNEKSPEAEPAAPATAADAPDDASGRSCAELDLSRDAFGRLVLILDGVRHESVVPVRSFPITASDYGISLVGQHGTELAWVERLDELSASARGLIAEELACREFIPAIRRIVSVSTFATPSVWQVETDRGAAQLTLRAEEGIRRLSPTALLIADGHGIEFLVRDISALDKGSRRLLDRFL